MERAFPYLAAGLLVLGLFSNIGEDGGSQPRSASPPSPNIPSPVKRTVENILDAIGLLQIYDLVVSVNADQESATIRTGNIYITHNVFYPIRFMEDNNLNSRRDVDRFLKKAQNLIVTCTDAVLSQGNKPVVFMYQARSKCLVSAGYSENDVTLLNAKFPMTGGM